MGGLTPRGPRQKERYMVTYDVRPEGPIVFTAEVDGFGPVTITSRTPDGRTADNRPL